MKVSELVIRRAKFDEVGIVSRIWMEGVSSGFGADPPPLDNVIEFFAERIRKQTPLFGIWVAIGDHQILGWQAMQPCRNNPISADRSAESSTYVADGHKGKGVGKALIAFALEHARRTNMLYVQGIIGANNWLYSRIYG
jgi:L-amino acid N-acyltransferase YncA